MKAKVDKGATLDGNDMQFLRNVFEDAGQAQSLVARHPEFKPLVAKLISLYHDITKTALENEENSRGKPT
jgi:hypothetical protein